MLSEDQTGADYGARLTGTVRPLIEDSSLRDFFISYTAVDQEWAEWVAHTLEAAGFTTIIQAWDFRPGHNFALEMEKAAVAASRTIVILSSAYLQSRYAASEWAAAFARDPDGEERRLIPVRVERCEVEGLHRPIIYIDLIGLNEQQAAESLLSGVREGRAKPPHAPPFPGARDRGATQDPAPPKRTAEAAARVYMPKVRRSPTDADRRRFLRHAFDTIQEHFAVALRELHEANPDIDTDFQVITATEFRAEIFLNGRSVSCSRFWQGTIFGGDGISVSDGAGHQHNSCNESLSVESNDEGDLRVKAYVSDWSGLGGQGALMNESEAADYLWRRFVRGLECE